MAKTFLYLAALAAVILSGCAIARDTETDVGTSLQQGLRGQGRLISPDQTTDSFGPEYQ